MTRVPEVVYDSDVERGKMRTIIAEKCRKAGPYWGGRFSCDALLLWAGFRSANNLKF